MISPYAKQGYIDHQTLSFDAYDKFIEDDFLHGQRLDPATDGRPDPRPDVRENEPILGNLVNDFNFNQPPRPPVILPVHPTTTLTGTPARSNTTSRKGRGQVRQATPRSREVLETVHRKSGECRASRLGRDTDRVRSESILDRLRCR